MSTKNSVRTNAITADLATRKLTVHGIIANDENGNIQILGYDDKGLVSFISKTAEAIQVFENVKGKRNAVQPMAEMGQ